MPHRSVKARIYQKTVLVLELLADEPFSSARILSHVLRLGNRQTQATLAAMAGKKLIQVEVLPDGNRVYGITSTGLAYINCDSGKPFESGKVHLATIPHTLLTQKIRLDLISYGASGWSSRRELYKRKFFTQVPDAAFRCGASAFVYAAEIELNIKSAKRAKDVFINYVQDMGDFDEPYTLLHFVIYFTPYPSAIRKFIDLYVPEHLRDRFYVHQIDFNIPFYVEQPKFVRDAGLEKFLGSTTVINWD